MEFEFKSRRLEKLYTEEKGTKHYPSEVVDAFFEVTAIIASAMDENEFYRLKHLHFEKLTHTENERSMKLHGRWRLIVSLEKAGHGIKVVIKEISNHYGD